MQLTNLLVLGAALGAMAAPGHSHFHRAAHERRDPAFYKPVHHSKVGAPATTTVAVAAASKTSAAASTTASAAPAAASSSSSSVSLPSFCGANKKRATLADISSTGNTGSQGWGSNIKLVDSSDADECEYVANFINVDSSPYQVVCSNKIGADGLIDGFWQSALTFQLAPGETKVVAVDADSQGFCAIGKGSVQKTVAGQWAGTYLEFDMASTRNKGWSGADLSSLVAASQPGLDIASCELCNVGGTSCSTIKADGTGVNAFIAGTAALDGLGMNLPAGPVNITVKVGYQGS